MTSPDTGAPAPAVFHFNSQAITVILKDGDPWFIASEVCAALELRNHSQVVSRLDDDEKGVHKMDTLGGKQEATIISEPGLYRLTGRSNKPAAKTFNRWVCHDVLPAIRKTGRYEATQSAPVAIAAPETELDRQKRSRINRRALELSHRAYETYRDQMRTCHLILGGMVEIERWLPPELARNIVADAKMLAAVCDIYRENFMKSADTIARLAGLADE